MNVDRERAVALALQYLREMKPDDHGPAPTDAWTDTDWDLWRRANPLQRQMTEVSGQILEGQREAGEYVHELLSGGSPFSVEKGAWAIIEDAIHRRGFLHRCPREYGGRFCR
jgi:hypothetical protein